MISPFSLAPARLTLAFLMFCGWLACAAPAEAQDRLTFKDRHTQDGKITGFANGSIMITSAVGQMSYNIGLIDRVDAVPPPSYQAGYAAYQAGDWDKALAALKPVVDQFRGLPTLWAMQATAAMGDIYIEKNDVAKAEAAYNDFRTLYPASGGSSVRMNLAQARISFARNDAAKALGQLVPLRDAALKQPAQVTKADGAAYGQACFLLGQLEERKGQYQDALQDYLRTVTLFYEDSSVTARAQKSADALRAAHKDVSIP